MKGSITILSILLISCIGLVFGSPLRFRESLNCLREIYKQRLDQSDCIDNVYNETAFYTEMDELTHYYTGDENTIREFAEKYCPVLDRVIECLHLRHDISQQCQIYNPEVESTRVRISKAVLNFVCADNAKVLIDIIPNDGLRLLGNSMLTSDCTREIMQVDVENKDFPYFQVNPLYCRALESAISCQLGLVQSHDNLHMINVINGFHATIRDEIGC